MIDALPLLLGPEGYQISRSVRLRSSASAYLSRTFSSGTRTTWTWSSWVKRGAVGVVYPTTNHAQALFGLNDSDKIYFYEDSLWLYLGTGATYTAQPVDKFRDPSAWYHIVVVLDTTNATSADRIRLYVNNRRITVSGTMPTQNWASSNFNSAINHNIGKGDNANGYFFDGYLTEVNFIDGQALTPSSFGETNPVTGVWQPKKYAGTYGTNGFYLNFNDNSAATAAAIGKDYSGNGNNWTPNNISVTAGVTYDSMLDVPTQWADGGNGRGNYAVLNPLNLWAGSASTSVSNGNLTSQATSSGTGGSAATIAVLSGKYYWEVIFTTIPGGNFCAAGLYDTSAVLGGANSYNRANHWILGDVGTIYANADGGTASGTGAFSAGDVARFAFDADTGKLWVGKNGTWVGTPGTSGEVSTLPTGKNYAPISVNFLSGSSGVNNCNFGQRPFSYTPPTGFKALNTLNLPTPTILKGNQYFDATLYTGNGTGITVTNSGSMQPDFVWAKNRSNVADHALYDVLRTAMLSSNTTAAEVAASNVVSYNSNGFTISGGDSRLNANGNTYVGWQWKEGATQGFDIVTYTGNGGTQNISHNLGVAPRMMIVKSRSTAQRWTVFHTSISNAYIYLNETFAADTANAALRFGNNSAVVQPTSSVFTIGNSVDVNQNTTTYVAYLFAAVAGYSAFGSYTGNGSADGPFVFLGFRPRWILTKAASGATGSWWLYDTARSTYNEMTDLLRPDLSNADTTQGFCDALSNGFKIRNSGNNTNGATYIYMAFAENPFKNALAR